MFSDQDHRYMAACLRLARRHRSLTGTNPSVGTLLVRDGVVVGKGVTAKGGRPHSERQAVDQAGELSRGATAYVSLEPCAHHGATPPCAQGLIDAGVSRVVTAWIDPDNRVDGKGHTMLMDAGIEVHTGLMAETAAADLSGYLNRKQRFRPQVTLKLAVSQNGQLGIPGQEVPITGPLAKSYTHRLRAEHDAILVGRGTADADDPDLRCRLQGLERRSPHRFVLSSQADLNEDSILVKTARITPVSLITEAASLSQKLVDAGVRRFGAQSHTGELALPEILEDMASQGISSLMVEGGAKVAQSFLHADLVDELLLFESPKVIDGNQLPAPISPASVSDNFKLERTLKLGDDLLRIYRRT